MKAALAAGIALAALAIAPNAEAAKRGWIYDVTKATGFEKVTFIGDNAGGCDLYKVCGYSGQVGFRDVACKNSWFRGEQEKTARDCLFFRS